MVLNPAKTVLLALLYFIIVQVCVANAETVGKKIPSFRMEGDDDIMRAGKQIVAEYEGNTCMEEVMSDVTESCNELLSDEDRAKRIALRLAKCFVEENMKQLFECASTDRVSDCVDRISSLPIPHSVYNRYHGSMFSVCYFLLNTRLDKGVEYLLNSLVSNTVEQHNVLKKLNQESRAIYEITLMASAQNKEIMDKITLSKEQLDELHGRVENGLKIVKEQQGEVMEKVSLASNETLKFIEEEKERFLLTKESLMSIGEKTDELGVGITSSLENEMALADAQRNVEDNLKRMQEEQEAAIKKAKESMEHLQSTTSDLTGELKATKEENKVFFNTMAAVFGGVNSTLSNFKSTIFFIFSGILIYFTTSTKRTMNARLWLYLLLLLCLGIELLGSRLILGGAISYESSQDGSVEDRPIPWLDISFNDLTYYTRRGFLVLSVIIFAAIYWNYVDYQHLSHSLLEQNSRKLLEAADNLSVVRRQNEDIIRMLMNPYNGGIGSNLLNAPEAVQQRSLSRSRTLPYTGGAGRLLLEQRRRATSRLGDGRKIERGSIHRVSRVVKKKGKQPLKPERSTPLTEPEEDDVSE